MAKRTSGAGDGVVDPLIKVSTRERQAWRAQREKRELTTRQLGTLLGVSNGEVSNVETGKTRTIKRSLYAAWLRVLFRVPDEAARSTADEVHAESTSLFKRLARISMLYDDDELKDELEHLERRKRRKTEDQ